MRSIAAMFNPATIAARIRSAYASVTKPKRRRQTGRRQGSETLESRQLMSVANPINSRTVVGIERDDQIVMQNGRYFPNLNSGGRWREPDSDRNDEISEAIGIGRRANSETYSGAIKDGKDVDIFRVTVTAGERLTFDIDVPDRLDSVVRLFDSRGVQIAINNNAASPGESRSLESYIDHTFANSGTFFVGVSGRGNSRYNPITGSGDRPGSTGDYYLTIRDGAATTAPRPQKPFDTQNNNSLRQAENIGFFRRGNHSQDYFGSLGTQSDRVDWVKFYVDGTTSGRIRASGRTDRGGIVTGLYLYVDPPNITLYDSSHRLVNSTVTSGPRADEINLNGLPRGVYFLRIRPAETSNAGRYYALNLNLNVS